MKRCVSLLIGILLFVPSLSFSLTLEEAVSRALKNNPGLMSERNLSTSLKYAVKAEKGKLLPRIDFIAQAKRLSDPQPVVSIAGPGKFPKFSKNLYLYQFNAVLPLYEGGRIRKSIQIASLAKEAQANMEKLTALNLIAEVKKTYFFILYAKSLIKAYEKTVEALKKAKKDAELRLSLGKIPPLDLMRIDAQLEGEKAYLASAKEAYSRAVEALLILMGEKPDKKLSVNGYLKYAPYTLPSDYEHLLLCRPDINAQEIAVEKAEKKVELAFREHFPSVEVFSSYGKRAGAGLNYRREVWEAGIQLKINLYSGGVISSKVSQEKALLLHEKEKLRELKLKAEKEVLDAISRIKEAEERVKFFKASKLAAKEAFRIENLKYKTGAGTITDMLVAQAEWFRAESSYVQALYELTCARIDYEYATATIGRGFIKLSCGEADEKVR